MRDWAEKILAGDTRALARAATLVENRRPEAEALLRELFPSTGRARIIGITGPPGSGKSTLVDQLVRALRAEGRTAGIIAVDPTSPYTGGAILGDRIRMQAHHADPGVFIRSMANRGAPGGLAAATTDIALLLDAAGKQDILIETVGVGQDEVEIARLADVTLVVLVPGMGDDVQAIKAGIMEIADLFVLNKADHPGAERMEREIQAMLGTAPRQDAWTPPVLWTVASEGKGIEEVLAGLRRFQESGLRRDRQKSLWDLRIRKLLEEKLMEKLTPARISAAAGEIAGKQRDPYSVADELLQPLEVQESGPGGYAIDHIGIAVKSLDRALAFYEGLLGMSVLNRETLANQANVATLSALGSRIELLEAVRPESIIGRFLKRRGEGIHHIALRVPNFWGALERLKRGNAQLLTDPSKDAEGRWHCFVHPAAAVGVLLELVEAEQGGAQTEREGS